MEESSLLGILGFVFIVIILFMIVLNMTGTGTGLGGGIYGRRSRRGLSDDERDDIRALRRLRRRSRDDYYY